MEILRVYGFTTYPSGDDIMVHGKNQSDSLNKLRKAMRAELIPMEIHSFVAMSVVPEAMVEKITDNIYRLK